MSHVSFYTRYILLLFFIHHHPHFRFWRSSRWWLSSWRWRWSAIIQVSWADCCCCWFLSGEVSSHVNKLHCKQAAVNSVLWVCWLCPAAPLVTVAWVEMITLKKKADWQGYTVWLTVKRQIFPQDYGLLFREAWQYFPVDSFLLNLALFSCDCMQEGDGSRDCDLHVDNILFAPGLMYV